RLGYDGPVQPEPFTPSLGDLPFEQAAARVKAAMDSVWPG
ncbi:MAG: sugar phosphate isomerase/epimerase, partial [Clostridiaceae bacterium]|nr:sugar phosphate isomerase/epimerase [Clostridiaceae bacterium]